MKTFRMPRTFLIAFLALLFAFGTRAPAGFVLCLGSDGHVDIGVSVNDRCGPAALEAPSESEGWNAAADHCGDCSDYPLLADAGPMAQSKGSAPAATGRVWSEPLPAVLARDGPVRVPYRPPPLASISLHSLRTIRLLV
jgi:hypothetical protein